MNGSITGHDFKQELKDSYLKQSRTGWIHDRIPSGLQRELTATFLKLFYERKKKNALPNSFYKVSIILIQNEIKTESK